MMSARYSRPVTTASSEAQRWFDRGLNWCFGYHHEEAVRLLREARWKSTRTVPWPIGVSATPPDRTITSPGNCKTPPARPQRSPAPMIPARAALALGDRVTAPERALIEALPARYPQRDPIDDQRPWNDAFADAMRFAHQAHPDDLDRSRHLRGSDPQPHALADVGPAHRRARARRRHARGARGARVRVPRSARGDGPSRPSAPARPPDGDVAASRGGAGNRRPAARAVPRHGPPDAHAHPYRHPMRPLPRRDALEPEGDHRGPQVLRPRRADEFLFGLPGAQLPLRRLWGDVPRPVRARHRRRRRADRDDARGDAAHPLTADG